MFSSETSQHCKQTGWYQTCPPVELTKQVNILEISLIRILQEISIFKKHSILNRFFLKFESGWSIIKDVAPSGTQPSAPTSMIQIKCKWCGKVLMQLSHTDNGALFQQHQNPCVSCLMFSLLAYFTGDTVTVISWGIHICPLCCFNTERFATACGSTAKM